MEWSTIAGGVLGFLGGSQANRSAARISQKQMDFQERMSSTAYQRAAKDLEAAGLNRILAIGSPSSSPAGSQAPVQDEAAAALQAAMASAQVDQIKAQAKKTKAEEENIKTQETLNSYLINEAIQRTEGHYWENRRKQKQQSSYDLQDSLFSTANQTLEASKHAGRSLLDSFYDATSTSAKKRRAQNYEESIKRQKLKRKYR